MRSVPGFKEIVFLFSHSFSLLLSLIWVLGMKWRKWPENFREYYPGFWVILNPEFFSMEMVEK